MTTASLSRVTNVSIGHFLDRKLADEVICQIKGSERVHLMLNSGGGSIGPTLEVIRAIEEVPESLAIVYQAESSAAAIALACQNRKITGSGTFSLHTGSYNVESCSVEDGRIPKHLLLSMMKYKAYLFKRLTDLGFKDPRKIDQLRTGGWLKMPAEEWVQSGLLKWG